MSNSQQTPWSNNRNAPKISYHLYIQEKIYFFGILVDPILYGTRKIPPLASPSTCNCSGRFLLGLLVVLFFKCMAALFDPVHRRGERTKWGLVSYTVLMFLVATAQTAMSWYIRVISYVDNREFPGIEGAISPGPVGYRSFIFSDVSTTVSNSDMFFLNGWFADGFLVNSVYFLCSPAQVANAGASSSIVATSSTPRTSGSSHFPASCTSDLSASTWFSAK